LHQELSDRTFRPGHISHHFGVGAKLLWHGVSTGEHQSTIVVLQVVVGSPEVCKKASWTGPSFSSTGSTWVPSLGELYSSRNTLLTSFAEITSALTSIGDYLDVGRNNADWGEDYKDSDEGK